MPKQQFLQKFLREMESFHDLSFACNGEFNVNCQRCQLVAIFACITMCPCPATRSNQLMLRAEVELGSVPDLIR